MQKVILVVLALLLITVSLGGAEPPQQTLIAVSPQGRLVLTRFPAADGIAFNDRITLEHSTESREVFASEGRDIQQVIYADLDGDGVGELLIQMDLGGSGGFREFELLCLQDGIYHSVWSETGYAAGEASVRDSHNNRKLVQIVYMDTETDPPVKDSAVFEFRGGTLQQCPNKGAHPPNKNQP